MSLVSIFHVLMSADQMQSGHFLCQQTSLDLYLGEALCLIHELICESVKAELTGG